MFKSNDWFFIGMKTIIVTGTPCTGKTTLAKTLAKKLNFNYIDANKIVKKYNIAEGYDKKRKTKIVDANKLNKALIKEIETIKKYQLNKKSIIKNINIENSIKDKSIKSNKNKKIKNKNIENGIIIDSHLSHYLPKKCVDLCIVAKCDIRELKRRLENRGYDKNKVRENLDAEIFDVCLSEAKEMKHEVFTIATTKGINPNKLINKINKI